MNRNYWESSVGLFLACAVGAAAAQTMGPPADYKISPDYTSTSPDGTTTIEQYAKIGADGSYTWQFWARRKDKLTMLKPEQPDYAAGFRFTNDSRWLVRMQKTGSGEGSCTSSVRKDSMPRRESRSVTWHGLISTAVPISERSGSRIFTSRRIS